MPTRTATPARKTARKAPAPITWVWRWQSGGYNSAHVATREAALAAARAMTAKCPACVIDESTLEADPTGEKLRALDRQFAGMFD